LEKRFKTRLLYLAPIAGSLLVGTLCVFLILSSSIPIYQVTPFSEENMGFFASFSNAFYFVILAGIGATLLYLLIKRRSRRLISMITGVALTAAFLMLSIVYLSAAFSMIDVPYWEEIILTASIFMTAAADFVIFRVHGKPASLLVLCIGGALGAFLGISIPTLSAALILGFLAVYDVFAVYRGPVGKIAHSGLEQLRGLSFSFRDIQMGLGDLTFYSMLSGHMLFNFGITSCIASTIGILSGCFLSFKMLEKKEMFPGLPLPIALGLATGFLGSLV
jgi:presenilin-like A22 family membrane protease